MVGSTREGEVEIHRDTTDSPAYIWASCDLTARERQRILEIADRCMNTDELPHGTAIGEVVIDGGDIDFTPYNNAIHDSSYNDPSF